MLPAPPGAGLGETAGRPPASMTTMPETVPRSNAGHVAAAARQIGRQLSTQ